MKLERYPKKERYRVAVMAHGVLFWRDEPYLCWSVFVEHEGLVTQAMAASLLGKGINTINRWVHSGRLYSVKVPGRPSMIPLRAALAARPTPQLKLGGIV